MQSRLFAAVTTAAIFAAGAFGARAQTVTIGVHASFSGAGAAFAQGMLAATEIGRGGCEQERRIGGRRQAPPNSDPAV